MSGVTRQTPRQTPSALQSPVPLDRVTLRDEADSRKLDWPAIFRHLEQSGIPVDVEFAPRQFAGGLANLNFLLRVDDGWVVLRRPPDGVLPPGANDMAREHRILSRLWEQLPLAPRSLLLCEDARVAGAPFQLLEYRAGLSIRGDRLDPLPETPDIALALSETLVGTLVAVHAVDPTAVGLDTLGRPEGFFERTTQGWIARAETAAGDVLAGAARDVAVWLRATAPPAPGVVTLLHNDFKLDNLLIDPVSLQPTAILDWDMGTRGNPLFDLATLLSYWTEPYDPSCMHRLAQMPTARSGFATREQAAAAYAGASGRDVGDLKPWRVLAMFKLATVFQQLHSRHVIGETDDPRYAGFGGLAEELFAFTLDVAHDKFF